MLTLLVENRNTISCQVSWKVQCLALVFSILFIYILYSWFKGTFGKKNKNKTAITAINMSREWAHPAFLLLLLGLLFFETGHTCVANLTGHTGDTFRRVLAVDWHFFNKDKERRISGNFNVKIEAMLKSIWKTVDLFFTFRFDVWTTESPLNDFLSFSIFGL